MAQLPNEIDIEFDLTFHVKMRVDTYRQGTEIRIFAEYVEAEISRRSMKPLETFKLKETQVVDGHKK